MYLTISRKENVTFTVYKTHILVLELMKNLFDLAGIVTVISVLLSQMQGELPFCLLKILNIKFTTV